MENWEKRSNTKQDAFNKEANNRAEIFLAEQFCPTIKKELSLELRCDANIYIDENDKQTVIFAYPNLFTNPSTLQVIRLEIGALAAWTPAKLASIEPYTAVYYPKIFKQKNTEILTVSPERTFWEKATILHHEANRPELLDMPQRYSRHYYDLYRMAQTPVKDVAFSYINLLKTVHERYVIWRYSKLQYYYGIGSPIRERNQFPLHNYFLFLTKLSQFYHQW